MSRVSLVIVQARIDLECQAASECPTTVEKELKYFEEP